MLTKDASIGEAQATVLAAQTATFCGPSSTWSQLVCLLQLCKHNLIHHFTIYLSINYRAHGLAKWAVFHLTFENILNNSQILFSIRIKSEKYLI